MQSLRSGAATAFMIVYDPLPANALDVRNLPVNLRPARFPQGGIDF